MPTRLSEDRFTELLEDGLAGRAAPGYATMTHGELLALAPEFAGWAELGRARARAVCRRCPRTRREAATARSAVLGPGGERGYPHQP